ncbi:hypothetical protein GCK72_023837 [Caenorhabditis remanei]|uniref:Uncharacterized protein n=1 Tax=Caenorhabditis remanei TaxID=31234 RepID=A0A6A5FXW9_CAERE|nr:hypothetical protein GCK72_023837 [Caenorhabditis remanei]KAF1747375.1 hypothetical protein GCK72_023837 [Caenorhabditis remanei]
MPVFRNTWRNIKVTRKSSSVYIDDDNRPSAAVQPIFNINSGPSPPSQVPQQFVLPPQLFQQLPESQHQQPQIHLQQQSQQQQQIPQRPQQLYPGLQNIMTPSGVIHLNLYTIQLPNGNNTYSSIKIFRKVPDERLKKHVNNRYIWSDEHDRRICLERIGDLSSWMPLEMSQSLKTHIQNSIEKKKKNNLLVSS